MGVSDTLYTAICEIDDYLNSGMYDEEDGNPAEDILKVRNEMFRLCLDMWYPDERFSDNDAGREVKEWKKKLMENPSPKHSPNWAPSIFGR